MQTPLPLAFLFLLLSIAGCASTPKAAAVSSVPLNIATTPVENEGMHERNEELVVRAKENPRARVMFLGDSITQGWDSGGKAVWDREFTKLQPINLGVSGDRTEHVLWRLEQGAYDKLRPDVIVLMIGTNNTGHRMDPPQLIADGVLAIVDQLKLRFPEAKIVLLAIFPRGANADDAMRKQNEATNALISKLEQRKVELKESGRRILGELGLL